ncbi:pancreatic triacylglycerol lipase [Anopheles bellator]|uniref:pancreatic triacylglycerol lipase n=1 Tax=Anopheles bellator TaxID=139047 RepID=UPI0026481483|nr:pancreatic triacylglycerol lipase [Anopheles bellator]
MTNLDVVELTREREQVLAAQQSIAEWRKSLKHPNKNDHHSRRKKRADRKIAETEESHYTDKNNATTNGEDPDYLESSVVCYGVLGCFHETDHLPEMLPSSPAEVNTRFLVYTTTHRSEKPLIEFSYEELVDAGFGTGQWNNATNETRTMPADNNKSSALLKTFGDLTNRSVRVIVHGFGSNCGLVWIYEMRTALMAVENCTVICVDWENGAKLPNYVRAAANTRLVGRQLALLLRLLRTHNRLQPARVHLIGFSLGSHVAGFAGFEFSNLAETTSAVDSIWRITGLDPAGPLFEAQPPEVRLDAGDAQFVDVIHSNGENLILGGLGSWQPMGTVDYYPNGGRVQHGCTNLFVGAVTDIIWAPPTTVEGRSLCNHRRAYKFFIDSVAPRCHFPAFPCESYDQFAAGECFDCGSGSKNVNSACGHMGYYATNRDVGGHGQLYLRTRDEEPYCANQFRLRLRNAPDELPLRTVGRFELTLEGGDSGNGVDDGSAVPVLTFNETFHLDETREDREFHAGQWLTTILVPHPALGRRPRALTITYRPYRGGWWQRSSVGKQLWRIGPILLTADNQKVYGSCGILTLQADVPVRVELAPILRDTLHSDAEECFEEVKGGPNTLDDVVKPDNEYLSWTPVAISIPRHTHTNEKRSFSDTVDTDIIPLDKPFVDTEKNSMTLPTAQTVQLFPSRLVSFFERAERYARRTWDALFNENVTLSTETEVGSVSTEYTNMESDTEKNASVDEIDDIRIALPTFKPITMPVESSVGSGRKHYTRFIPLVYESTKIPGSNNKTEHADRP